MSSSDSDMDFLLFFIDPNKWRKNCDCLDQIATGVRSLHMDQLDDKGIYYEPTDLYLRHLSFLNPPFYIINPTVKLKIEATDPKLNIRKLKIQNENTNVLQTFITSRRKNNIINNNDVSLKPTNIHLDVSSQEVTSVKQLTKKENLDCIELHYTNSNYDYNTLKLNNDDSTTIEQKFKDSVGILKQKPQDTKNKRSKIKELFKENYSIEQGLFSSFESEKANGTDISINNTLDNQNLSSKNETNEPEKLKQNLKKSFKNIIYLPSKAIFKGKEQVKNLYNQYMTIPSSGKNILTGKIEKDTSVNIQNSLYSTMKTKKAPVENFDVFNTDNMHLLKKSKETEKSMKQLTRESVFDENHIRENHIISGISKNNKLMLNNAEYITTQQDVYNSNKLISTQSSILVSSKNSYTKYDYIDKDNDKLKLFDDVTAAYTSTTSLINFSELVSPQFEVLSDGNNIKPNCSYLMNDQLEIITKEEDGTCRGKVENYSSTISDQNNNTHPDARIISKIVTREFENGTVVSSIYGSHISESETSNTSPQDFATRHINVTAPNYMKLIQMETKEEFLKGKMYFIFNNVHIPARFKQNENGDISVGIDGPALCKLRFAVMSLINAICREIIK